MTSVALDRQRAELKAAEQAQAATESNDPIAKLVAGYRAKSAGRFASVAAGVIALPVCIPAFAVVTTSVFVQGQRMPTRLRRAPSGDHP